MRETGSAKPAPGADRRVLFIINTLPPFDLSGAGEQVVQLAAGLRQHGFEVDLLGRGPGGASGPKVLFPLTVLWPTLRLLRTHRYDAVQVHESDGGLVAVMLWIFRFLRRGARVVALLQVSYDREAAAVRPLVDEQGGEIARPTTAERQFRRWRTPAQRLLGRWTARYADVVLVPSEQTAREVAADYGGRPPAVLPNAKQVSTAAPSRSAASWERGPLLFVGRLRIRKGVEVLLHALDRLRRDGIEVPLRIAGDGERRDALEQLACHLELEHLVEFLGFCDAATIEQEMSRARGLVVPSTYEGMPLVILEAMAMGLPVIASAVSGIPEVVIDGDTGWLVAPENVRELADTIAAALADPAALAARGEAGRARLQLYRPAAVAASWIEQTNPSLAS